MKSVPPPLPTDTRSGVAPNAADRADRALARAVKVSKAPAISRAAAVLRLLGKSEAPLALGTIARELGLNPSTCLYVLRALAAEELVAFDPDTRRYGLEAGVLSLARGWLRRDRFADLAQPHLDRLAHGYGVTMLGVQIMGLDHIVAVAVAQGGGFQLSVQVGSRFPALISATGRCIAAWGEYPPAELRTRFERLRWEEPPSFEEWQAQVAATRAQGFGVDEGSYISGVTVLAAPIWKAGTTQAARRPSHALVAIGIGAALRESGRHTGGAPVRAELEAALLGASRSLTDRMGGAPGI